MLLSTTEKKRIKESSYYPGKGSANSYEEISSLINL